MESCELGERLGAHPERLVEEAPQVPFAHSKALRNRGHIHVRAPQALGGPEREAIWSHRRSHCHHLFGDRGFENGSRLRCGLSVPQTVDELSVVGGSPELVERNAPLADGGSGHSENGEVRAEVKSSRHGSLSAENDLSPHCLANPHRVYVEASLNRGTEAKHDVNFSARNRDHGEVSIELVDEQRSQGSARRRARIIEVVRNGARKHREDSAIRGGAEQGTQRWNGRFFQSSSRIDRYPTVMKILITGATGKVGSRLAWRLAQRGHQVRALVRDRARAEDLRTSGVELVEGDLLNADSLTDAARGVDAVVHCAAFFRGATEAQAHAVNDLGTQHLANAARSASVKRFLFISTGLVYGPTAGRAAGEDDPCAPMAPYPQSKLAAERFLLALEGLDVRVLRLPFVYGDGDPHIAEAIPMMRSFSPTQRQPTAHHEDVAQAVALLLDAKSPAHRVYNLTDDEAPDLATLFAAAGAPPPDGSESVRGLPFDTLLDGRRLREDLGFKPKYPRLADAVAAGTA